MADTDGGEFAARAGQYRAELMAYCYRMLGSVQDAEDQVQEIMMRAWRARDGYEGRASMRTWLYRIATNVCLRALETRARRPLPSGLGGPAADLPGWPLAEEHAVPWLQPVPDALVTDDPASSAMSRASVRLALVAALQYLPARQRAVLILRDVLGMRASEVAEMLGTTTVAVNSALQRARTQLEQAGPVEDEMTEPDDAGTRDLLDRFAAAFEAADVDGLAELLREDVSLEMPPIPLWLTGRDAVVQFLGDRVLGAPGDWVLVPTAANGQPAVASYRARSDGPHLAHAIAVLTVGKGGISRIVSFNDAALFGPFGLPPVSDGRSRTSSSRGHGRY